MAIAALLTALPLVLGAVGLWLVLLLLWYPVEVVLGSITRRES